MNHDCRNGQVNNEGVGKFECQLVEQMLTLSFVYILQGSALCREETSYCYTLVSHACKLDSFGTIHSCLLLIIIVVVMLSM